MIQLLLAGAIVGFLVARTRPPIWHAREEALIQLWSIDSEVLSGQSSDLSSADQADAATIATSQEVLARATRTLHEPGLTTDALRGDVSATSSQTSHFVTLQATGSSPAQAQARVRAVSTTFVTVAKEKVLASATRLADLPSAQLGTNATATAIRLRATIIAQTFEPIRLYPGGDPVRAGVTTTTATAAGGILGLAVGALILVALSFNAPRLRTGADAGRRIGIPSGDWNPNDDPGSPSGVVADLRPIAANGIVAVCPLHAGDAHAAERFADWLSGAAGVPRLAQTNAGDRSDKADVGVVRVSPADSGLASARPDPAYVDALVVVTTAGTPAADVEGAVETLAEWRHIDGVIVMSTGR